MFSIFSKRSDLTLNVIALISLFFCFFQCDKLYTTFTYSRHSDVSYHGYHASMDALNNQPK